MTSDRNNNLDDILNNLKSQYSKPDTLETPQDSPEIDNLFDEVKSGLKVNQKTNKSNSQVEKKSDLDSIKAQYQNRQNTQSSNIDDIRSQLKNNKNTSDNKKSLTEENSNKVSQVDNYLDSFKNKYQNKQNTQQSNIEKIKSQLKSDLTTANNNSLKRNSVPQSNPQVDNSLGAIKNKYQHEKSWQKNQEELNYNRNKQEIIKQEQQKQLEYKQSKRKAERWLKELDPYSDEGMWFEQLAESYPSKLEAAISYLSTSE